MKKWFFLSLLFVLMLNSCFNREKSPSLEEKTYQELGEVLSSRKEDLRKYLETVLEHVQKMNNDVVMRTFFKAKKSYYALSKNEKLPEEIVASVARLKGNIQQHYLQNYLMFYDILFVDKNGDIFYTIRKEGDYHQNIFEGSMAETKLSKELRNNPDRPYIDFQFYEISGEPSAFFVEPVRDKGILEGWYILQFSINSIDKIFEQNEKLGRTGEIFLVNKEHYLLTNSRFDSHNTILKQRLSKENIESKFKERSGYKKVVDYRGETVMSTFDVFEFLETEWLIIAKKDVHEVETEVYKKEHEKMFPQLLTSLLTQFPTVTESNSLLEAIRVDMDEFHYSDSSDVMYTPGVSTCTAIMITYPEKFSYMAHISPYDKIYGKSGTDILGQMLSRISYFDVTESKKEHLRFHIVSTQKKSFKNCIDRIIDEGFFLSQIQVGYNPSATYANIYHQTKTNNTKVEWVIN